MVDLSKRAEACRDEWSQRREILLFLVIFGRAKQAVARRRPAVSYATHCSMGGETGSSAVFAWATREISDRRPSLVRLYNEAVLMTISIIEAKGDRST